MHASAYDSSAQPRRARTDQRRLATIIAVQGQRNGRARFVYTVREGSDGQGCPLFAARGVGEPGADTARAAAFRWCHAHGYEVVGYLEMPPCPR